MRVINRGERAKVEATDRGSAKVHAACVREAFVGASC